MPSDLGPRIQIHSIDELDELRELAKGASVEIVQLGPGAMRGVLGHVDLGLSTVHLNRFSLPARGRGLVAGDRWTFVVFPAETGGNFNSQVLEPGRMLVYPPGVEFEGATTGPFQDWVFTVDQVEFRRCCQFLFQRDASSLPHSIFSVQLSALVHGQLMSQASSMMGFSRHSPDYLSDEQTRVILNSQLIEQLVGAVFSSMSGPSLGRSRKSDSHRRIIRLCDEFVRTRFSSPITITDLCSVANVSERTLRNAFRNVVGVSPKAYLKSLRLNRTRIELKNSMNGMTTVSGAAMRNGFSHLSEFSRDYRLFFGELPSVTLRRV